MNIARAVVTALALLSTAVTDPARALEPSGNLIIVGNGPEQTVMEALARAFEKAHPRVYIDVLWDAQANPPEMVKRGQAHIAVSASAHPDLASTQIGWDGIGILVHLSNFTKELTKQQVALIFTGAVKEWSEVGGPETRISLIDRPRNQNIRDAFESQLEIVGKISDAARTIDSDDLVVKTVAGTLPPLSAVAYISLSSGLSAVSSGVAVRLLPVDKVEPEAPTVRDGRYSLRRPLLLLSRPQPDPLVQAFMTFARSAPGQAIVGNEYISLQSE
ncbi:MAG: substrate-binding domain-containing protein [Nitrospira sp.]|nr:substrate-binding domain-containing protein [Nitrospira sp.]MCP9461286.1 substrate-binding domain-containing protein [Nitrospira sp.]MCP9475930.1 substrate-binding domain-containing protein [Nitrospira sp.]